MAHVRKQIRDAFKARLAGVTGVVKIVGARAHAFAESELPALQVIITDEDISPLDDDEVATMRRPMVDVIIFTLGADGDDDTIDGIAAQVEALIASASGGIIWDDLVLKFPSGASLGIGGPAEQTLLMLRTRFPVRFSASDPETIGD